MCSSGASICSMTERSISPSILISRSSTFFPTSSLTCLTIRRNLGTIRLNGTIRVRINRS